MRSQGRLIVFVGLAAWGLVPAPVTAQEDRARVEAEARGQATEADRRFKEKDYAGALLLYQAERASRATLGDLRYEAYAARASGCCLAELGQYDAAVEAWNAARGLDAKREDPGFEGYDCLLIGNVEVGLGRLREAEHVLEQALPRLSQAGDREHEADARRLMGRVLTLTARAPQADPHFERAWELAASLNDAQRLGDVGADWGLAALELGEPGRAAEYWDDARRAFEGLGLPGPVALMDRQLGDALLALGLPEAAAARVEQAAEAHERLDDPAKQADDLSFLAELKASERALPQAIALARRAVSAHRKADDSEGEREALVLLAHYQSLAGDWKRSAATLADAVKLVRRDGEPAEQVRLFILAAGVERRAGDLDRERALLDEAERTAKEAKDDDLAASVADARRAGEVPATPKR
ncbi:MAG: hypothetical protein P4L84_26095 [Isosphaeraceae bacterium]|nr:hypothetical protein [Isosphaeraceae bacterium]